MEAKLSTETSLDTQRATWRYIPEDGTLHTHGCENLESYKIGLSLHIPLVRNVTTIPEREAIGNVNLLKLRFKSLGLSR
jgi:hypothetical protein